VGAGVDVGVLGVDDDNGFSVNDHQPDEKMRRGSYRFLYKQARAAHRAMS